MSAAAQAKADFKEWKQRPWTDSDAAQLAEDFEEAKDRGVLDGLAALMGRDVAYIERKAKLVGIGQPKHKAPIVKGAHHYATADSAEWKAGWRIIGPQRVYFRSRWEANYARYLQNMLERGGIRAWEFEPKTFWFDAIKRGVVSYKPDFRIQTLSFNFVWHEIKGFMDKQSATKLKRMAKYHPNELVAVIDEKAYRAIERRHSAFIDDWE